MLTLIVLNFITYFISVIILSYWKNKLFVSVLVSVQFPFWYYVLSFLWVIVRNKFSEKMHRFRCVTFNTLEWYMKNSVLGITFFFCQKLLVFSREIIFQILNTIKLKCLTWSIYLFKGCRAQYSWGNNFYFTLLKIL